MIVKRQKDIKFKNECGCIVDYQMLKEAILWYQSKPTASNKKIYLHGNYPAVSIHNKKIHVHRLIMMYFLKRKLKSNEHIHHKNHNKFDARIENLELLDASKHLSNHNSGRKFSKEHRKKIAYANKKRRGIKIKKRVNIDIEDLKEKIKNGWSINKIAKFYNCDWSTVKNRIFENPELLEQKR